MPDSSTPNYGLVLIEVGQSKDTWGTKVNQNSSDIDTALADLLLLDGSRKMTGSLNVERGSSVMLTMLNTGSGNTKNIQLSSNTAGVLQIAVDGTTTVAARVDPVGTTAPQTTTLMTREKGDFRYLQQADGDARYLQLSGGTLTGSTTSQGNVTITSNSAYSLVWSRGTSGNVSLGIANNGTSILFGIDGLTAGVLNSGAVAGDNHFLKRSDGDARYLQLSGGTVTGSVIFDNGQLGVGTTGSTNLNLRRESGPSYINVKRTDTAQTQVIFRDTNLTEIARVEAGGSAAPSAQTVITREKGDNRYSVAANAFPAPGAQWTDVLGSRADGVTYENTNAYPIAVNIGYRGQRGRMYVGVTAGTLVQVGGTTTAAGGENSDVHSSMTMIVPAGHFYKADQMFDLEVWAELV